ncbi:MAG TPA: glycosyltransferase family 39 protein, partial [Promineifilum sp.]|nr:glycosyltransferase family 39 protein [Promineifilum sp.]
MTAPGTQQETGFLPGNPVSKIARLLILLLLILLGYWLRVHNLDAFSFWTDEGLTPERSGYAIAQILRNDILIQGVVTTDTHPPLYYLILHLTRQLFGLSDFAFRYPSVLFGVLLIPLLYQLGRRMGGRAVGLIAALLAAVNPLQVYYSQEARMYSLLLLLVTGMSYVLWRAIQDTRYEIRGDSRRPTSSEARSSLVSRISYLVFPYLLLAALAVYTHYTAVFIVAAQALLWAWVLWRAIRDTRYEIRGDSRRPTSSEARSRFVSRTSYFVVACLILAVLVAIPLIPYTIPRLLAGAEANYYRVAPLTMLLDVVRFFNLGLTVDHARPLAGALNVLALGLALLGVRQITNYELRITNEERAPHSYLVSRISYLIPPCFLLSWLLAVVFGLMLGSLIFKPMYQGVRHIMAGSPAYLLLIAFGLAALTRYEIRDTKYESYPLHSYLVSRISYLLLGLLLVGYGVALANLYTDPAYVKDDFRAIVRFIETRAGDRDVIVYNNAVLLPLHDHYRRRDDLAVTALPAYPQFATGAEPELAALARDYDRVWFITDPPADKRDDDKLIQAWLDANLTETINRLFPARTTEARVIAYRTGEGEKGGEGEGETGSADSPLLPFSLSPSLSLIGFTYDSPLELPTLWVDLLWRGERPVVNTSLLFTLTGPDGKEYFREA